MSKYKLFATIFILACAGSNALASPVPDFTCSVPPGTSLQRDGYSLGENLYVFDNSVALEGYLEPSEQVPFKKAPGGTVTYYENDKLGVVVYPDRAEINLNSGLKINCQKHIDNGLSEGADGVSHGSSVRQSADVSGARIDKLPEGEPVFIWENAGNNYQGYDWFFIEYSEGLKGYVWGGTLCSVGFKVPGIANECGKPL